MFYTLIVYAFNNQIRFNADGNYNLPVGKRDFNIKMQNKVKTFCNALQKQNVEFQTISFEEFNNNIENFKNIIDYTEERIILQGKKETLKIYGSNFPAYVFDSNSHILNYLQNYKTKLLEFDSTIEKVRLITYEEAMAYTEDSEEYPWIYNTSFWTGTAGELRKVYAVSKDENIVLEDAKSISKYGIRPVIEMLDENIQR